MPPQLRTLLVAPHSNLPLVNAEIQDLMSSGLDVTRSLLGNVDGVDLTREVRRGEWDVLWLATHGNALGIQLSDGTLSLSALTQLIRGRFRLVVLNTCSSLAAAQQIQNETQAAVVCTIKDVQDFDAYRTASLFAHALARTGNPRLAYEQSKPGANTEYVYLAGARGDDFLSRQPKKSLQT